MRTIPALGSITLLFLLQRWLPLFIVACVALWLRIHDLGRRPMHADEANQAVKAGELLEHGHYAFDPHDHHGPTLYYAILPLAWARGEQTLADLTEFTLRLVPAIAGTAAVVLLGVVAWPLGRLPAIAAAAFMAVSPPAVYYSRYFIQETLLAAFTLAMFACVQRWWQNPVAKWAIAAGACLGLMHATKGNALLFVSSMVIAVIALRAKPAQAASIGLHTGFAIAAAVFVSASLHSSFGTNPGGLRDAVAVLGHGWTRLESATGHEKPWWYYLRLFTGYRDGGLLWEQRLFFALALGGFGAVVWRCCRAVSEQRQDMALKFLTGVSVYTVVVVAALSLTPYKTPWHSIHLVPGLALLGAGCIAAMLARPLGRLLAIGAACIVLGSLAQQTWRAAFTRPADARNPYAYVHSSPDVLKYRALAEASLARHPGQPIRIISEEYWPLPWYLRGLPDVGYWSAVPEDCDGALIVASALHAEIVKARLRGDYYESILGLRPGFICAVFVRQ